MTMKPGDKDFEVTKSDDDWQETLSPKQYEVLRCHGTEMLGTSPLNKEKREGTFICAGCGQPLRSAGRLVGGVGRSVNQRADAGLQDGARAGAGPAAVIARLQGHQHGAVRQLRFAA